MVGSSDDWQCGIDWSGLCCAGYSESFLMLAGGALVDRTSPRFVMLSSKLNSDDFSVISCLSYQ